VLKWARVALQQATSPDFNTPRHLRKRLSIPQQTPFQGRAGSWREKTLIRVFFTAKKFIAFDVLSRGGMVNQLYFINNIFPDLQIGNLDFRHQKAGSSLWVHIDNSICHNGSKLKSKIQKNHISRIPPQLYLPDISSCNFWLFEMFKQILRDQEFSPNDEIEDAIAHAWNDLTFDDVQSVFRDLIRRLSWVAELLEVERQRAHIAPVSQEPVPGGQWAKHVIIS
jgi:hypothetical protein